MSQLDGAVAPRDCPYVGLDYYQEKFGAWFFGRDAERDKIITNLQAARLTLLHAESGVGKSSVLRAGVAWQLRRARQEPAAQVAATDVPVVFSSWQDDPVPGLVGAISKAIEPFLSGRPKPELPADRLDKAIEAAAGAVDANLLVILDQFEEYFLYRSREPTPERFADELARCINRAELPANFLIAIREDAYAGLGGLFKGRIANVYGNYLHIDYLDRASAEKAIREPLEVYNGQPDVPERIKIQDELVGAVLDQVRAHDAGGDPIQGRTATANGGGDGRVATPLLQLVMETIWQRERAEGSAELRLSTLQNLQGVTKIVDTHLGEALRALGGGERQTAIDAFDYLVTPSGGKIAESVPDLAQRTGHNEQQLGSVLEKLDHMRIVRPVPAPPGQDPLRFRRYEIFHDVLAPTINRVIAARAEQRRMRRIQRFAALAVVLLVVVTFGAFWFRHLSNQALSERNQVITNEVFAEAEQLQATNPSLAAQLDLVAHQRDPTQASTSLLLDTANIPLSDRLTGPTGIVRTVASSPDGHTLAAGSADGKVWLWNVTDPAHATQIGHPLTGPGSVVRSVAFSPDGHTLAAGSADGKVWLWNVTDPAHATQIGHPLTGPTGIVRSVAFSPDGHTLAAASADGKVWLWNVTDPAHATQIGHPLTGPGSVVRSVAFSPERHTLAAGSDDNKVWLWNVTDPAHATQIGHPLTGPTGGVESVAFSPDGHTLAAGSDTDDKVWLWNVTGPAHATQIGHPLTGPVNDVWSVAFSPDGHTLAAGSADGKVWLWNVTDPAHATQIGPPLAAAAGPVWTVAFSPDGHTLAAGGTDGTIRLWNLLSTVLMGPTSGVDQVAFSPDAHILAAGGADDGKVWLWNVTDPAHATQIGQPLTGPTGGVWTVAFSPERHTLAAGGADDKVWLWNVTGPAHATQIGHPLTGPTGGVESVAFSPDGHTLAAGSADGKVWLWNVTGPAHATQIGRPLTGPAQRRRVGGVQPGRAHPGRRQRGRQGVAVERHRPRPRHPDRAPLHRAHRHSLDGGVQPGRAHPGRRQRLRRSLAVERHRPRPRHPDRAAPHRARRPLPDGGVQPGRAHPGRRQRRRRSLAVERHRSRPRHLDRATLQRARQRRRDDGVQPGRAHPGRRQQLRLRRHDPAVRSRRRSRHPPDLRHHQRQPHPRAVGPLHPPTAVRPAMPPPIKERQACSSIAPAYREANLPPMIRAPAATSPPLRAAAWLAAGRPGPARPSQQAPAPCREQARAPGRGPAQPPMARAQGPARRWPGSGSSDCGCGQPSPGLGVSCTPDCASRGPRRRATVVCAIPAGARSPRRRHPARARPPRQPSPPPPASRGPS